MRGKFKAGDKIQVVNSTCSYLEQGSIHTAHEVFEEDGYTYVSLSENGRHEEGGWDIDRFVKYEEKEKTVKVEMNKKYRVAITHRPVRIICTDREYAPAPCVGLFTDEDGHEGVLFFDHCGYLRSQQIIEEIPSVDWSKVKVDTPIFVKYAGDLLKRHFNKFDGKHVYFYPDGTTSFTCPEGDPGFAESVDNCWLEEPK